MQPAGPAGPLAARVFAGTFDGGPRWPHRGRELEDEWRVGRNAAGPWLAIRRLPHGRPVLGRSLEEVYALVAGSADDRSR